MDYLRYYLNTLLVAVAILGFYLGGQWVWLGASTYLFLLVLDLMLPNDYKNRQIHHPFFVDLPLYLHVALMLIMYGTFAWRIKTGFDITTNINLALLGCFASLVWISAVPNLPVAHELMHRRGAFERFLANIAATFFFDPHRAIGHVHTHHLHFDTENDSDTPQRGEKFYQFIWRATKGAYMDTFELEKRRLSVKNKSVWGPGSLVFWGLVAVFGTPLGIGLYAGALAGSLTLAVMVTTKFVLEALNYLQHYGLQRVTSQPIEDRHTWHHFSTMSRIAGVEITNHIDHHRDGFLPFYNLQVHKGAPEMPSVFICAPAALIPWVWDNLIVKPRLKKWDLEYASSAERKLAREANRRAGWPDWIGEAEAGLTQKVAA
ncbi:MAG: fatty acid desaturase [Rugosibacter sp.]|jgi:alkane 1-monooxygenase|nr:K704 [uncultured bacterium]MDO8313953.1 fatty acid desaturase [Rugosibacter sp.]MDO9271609.1 fatty acid desaturase [Rugosibacter sp.]